MEVRPKKSLGQHFLRDLNSARKIVDSLRLEATPHVVEVGPGMGVLTQFLLERPGADTRFIEIDRESVDYLRSHFSQAADRVMEADFLQTDLSRIYDAPTAVIGNFPYNISSQIFFRILRYRDWVPEVVCMVQKEVAQRLASPPGNRQYGILSVLLQAFYDIDYLFTVPEQVFSPPPKVKSAVIRLTRNATARLACDEDLFFTVVKTAFNQRRKTLSNSLKGLLHGAGVQDPLLSMRPEQLGVADFVRLTTWCEMAKNNNSTE